MAGTTIRAPSRRECECCGRKERWDAEHQAWVLAKRNGSVPVGEPHCIHEWDINGTFSPYE